MSRILIENGRIVDPSQDIDRTTSLLIENGKIAAYDALPDENVDIIDASGRIVAPGLIDLCTELREPGWEEDETIATGTMAAISGGFTSIACTPDTDPPIDTPAGVEFIHQKAARADHCNVFALACVSKGREGKELAEIGSLVEAGAVGFGDGDAPIQNSELLRRALEYCRMFDAPVFNRPEVVELSHGGVMHEGRTSMVLGLPGIPIDAEDVMTGRDLRLAESTGGRLHLKDISSAGSIEAIRRAKLRGVSVTASMCPQNFIQTDEVMRSFDTNLKVNPPLRTKTDVEACIDALRDKTIDVISSGHKPRAAEKKMLEIDLAPFGMNGLETMLPLVISHLISPGHLCWLEALEKMTINPARILGINKGTLQIGADADVTIIDPHVQWKLHRSELASKSSNTPWLDTELNGRAELVLIRGERRQVAFA